MFNITKKYTDLIVNKDSKNLCIPNMLIEQNQIIVFDQETLNKLYKNIQTSLKKDHKITMSIMEIQELLKKCDDQAFDIYKGPSIYYPYTALIRHFHLDVKEQLFYKYCRNIDFLLDIGSGKLTDAQFWTKVGIRNVIGIEPSKESIEKGYERQKKYKTKTKINVINGLGDVDWKSDKKYNPIFEHTYDVITFQFTLHYMMHNIEILMKNILQVSKKGTKVIITCMDGRLIHTDLQKHNRIEIRNVTSNNKEPIFAIIPQYDYKQLLKESDVLVYFKGTYGVESGSVEPLIDISRLISFFSNNGFKLLEIKKFLDYNSKNKQKMSDNQKKVSYYYTSIVFDKN